MKIKTKYIDEDRSYAVEFGEQVLNVPSEIMGRLVSSMQVALYRQRCAKMEAIAKAKAEKVQAAKKVVEESNHPDVLPFAQERPPRKPPGRPPGIRYTAPLAERLKKSKPKKQKPVENTEPFHHTKYR